jgi:hypothetical protein
MSPIDKTQYWLAHIDAWRGSGLSQTQYCKQQDIKLHNFVYWRKRLRPSAEPSTKLLKIGGVSTSSRVVLSLPLGIRMEVSASDLSSVLPAVLRSLRESL